MIFLPMLIILNINITSMQAEQVKLPYTMQAYINEEEIESVTEVEDVTPTEETKTVEQIYLEAQTDINYSDNDSQVIGEEVEQDTQPVDIVPNIEAEVISPPVIQNDTQTQSSQGEVVNSYHDVEVVVPSIVEDTTENSYHDVDIIIPSIHEDDTERNNTYHDVDIIIPSIHE